MIDIFQQGLVMARACRMGSLSLAKPDIHPRLLEGEKFLKWSDQAGLDVSAEFLYFITIHGLLTGEGYRGQYILTIPIGGNQHSP